MLRNRSVPVNTVLPHILYRDLAEALSWLKATFGFSEHYRYGDPISGAQIYLGGAFLMISGEREGRASAIASGSVSPMVTVFVEDVDEHFARTKAAGATIVEDLGETVYGERQYGVQDLEGHRWLFSTHVRDVSPDEWGAAITSAPRR